VPNDARPCCGLDNAYVLEVNRWIRQRDLDARPRCGLDWIIAESTETESGERRAATWCLARSMINARPRGGLEDDVRTKITAARPHWGLGSRHSTKSTRRRASASASDNGTQDTGPRTPDRSRFSLKHKHVTINARPRCGLDVEGWTHGRTDQRKRCERCETSRWSRRLDVEETRKRACSMRDLAMVSTSEWGPVRSAPGARRDRCETALWSRQKYLHNKLES